MTLIVVTETPIAWHDTEAFLEETKVRENPRSRSGLLAEKLNLTGKNATSRGGVFFCRIHML